MYISKGLRPHAAGPLGFEMRLRSGEVAKCIGELRLPSGEVALYIGDRGLRRRPEARPGGSGGLKIAPRRLPGGSGGSKIALRRLPGGTRGRQEAQNRPKYMKMQHFCPPRAPPGREVTPPRAGNEVVFGAWGETTEGGT